MSVSFADVVHQQITFDQSDEASHLVLRLIDTPWVQRLRDISQTANTRLVYMFSEHSRFGHSLGVAALAINVMDKLARDFGSKIAEFRNAVAAAAILHDIGHLAPGSHTAFKTWFPNALDCHEHLAEKIIRNDTAIQNVLNQTSPNLIETVCQVLSESVNLPAWTVELLSGGAWNVDRGNWCAVDSVMAGVSYGRYNIPALTESLVLSSDGHLALKENRLDAMMHFALSRHAMYRQVYQHRTLLAADTLNQSIAKRARLLKNKLPFCDAAMQEVLNVESAEQLSLETIFNMREAWWRYHLLAWRNSGDEILKDLSNRLLNRQLLKTIRVREGEAVEELMQRARDTAQQLGFDPDYYIHSITTADMQAQEIKKPLLVMLDDTSTRPLTQADPLFGALLRESRASARQWIAVPQEVKQSLGRAR